MALGFTHKVKLNEYRAITFMLSDVTADGPF